MCPGKAHTLIRTLHKHSEGDNERKNTMWKRRDKNSLKFHVVC